MSNDEVERRSDGSNGPSAFLILSLVVAAAVAIFIFQNGARARVEFLMFEGSIRTWVVILVSIIAGVILDRVVSIWWRRSRNRRNE